MNSQAPGNTSSSADAGELTFIELIRVLRTYRLFIVATIIVCLVLGTAAAFLMTPIYRAEASIAANKEDPSAAGGLSSMMSRFGGLAGMAGLSIGRRDEVAQAVVALGSPKFTRDFIREEKLLPIIFADIWDEEKQEWTVDEEDVPTLADGYDVFDGKIREIIEEEASIITIAVEWKDPELAAEWANGLIEKLNEKLRREAIDEANQTIEFLNEELDKTKIVQLQQAIYFMIENQINARTMANIREEYAFKVISPAIPPDEDKYVKPNRLFIIALSGIIGAIAGVFFSFLSFAVKRLSAELNAGQ